MMKLIGLLFSLFFMPFSAVASTDIPEPCGTNGNTIDERIDDCDTRIQSEWGFPTVDLVTRTVITDPETEIITTLTEVWLDNETGLLWGDKRDKTFSIVDHRLMKNPTTGQLILKKVWRDNEVGILWKDSNPCAGMTTNAEGKLPNVGWNLPMRDQFLAISTTGVLDILPNAETEEYWTSGGEIFFSSTAAIVKPDASSVTREETLKNANEVISTHISQRSRDYKARAVYQTELGTSNYEGRYPFYYDETTSPKSTPQPRERTKAFIRCIGTPLTQVQD